MADGEDVPYDVSLPKLAGKRFVDGNGVGSRKLKAVAVIRRQRARQARESGDESAAERDEHDAAYLERHADRVCDPQKAVGGPLEVGNGGEVVEATPRADSFQNMIKQAPDMLAAEATEKRMLLTNDVSDVALTLSLEAAESIGARDALERNLAHQVGTAHTVSMIMLAKVNSFLAYTAAWLPEERQQMQSIEAARLATAAARLLDASQRAALTIERLRNGGRQVVTVQHVTVQDGGQAIVAGAVDGGVRRK